MPTPMPVNIIFACHSSIYSALVLNHILLTPNICVLAVVESTCVKRREARFLSDVYDLIYVSGWRYAMYLLLITSIFSVIAALFGTISLKQLCNRHNIPVIKTANINSVGSIQNISALAQSDKLIPNQATYFVTVMFNQKISPQVLAVDGLKFINLHPGRLPEYRGVDPVLAAMINAEPSGVVSLHQLVESLDEGDLLSQQEVSIEQKQSLFANNMRFFKAGAEVLVSFLTSLEAEQKGRSQQGQGNYYSWPTKKDAASQQLFAVADWPALLLKPKKIRAG